MYYFLIKTCFLLSLTGRSTSRFHLLASFASFDFKQQNVTCLTSPGRSPFIALRNKHGRKIFVSEPVKVWNKQNLMMTTMSYSQKLHSKCFWVARCLFSRCKLKCQYINTVNTQLYPYTCLLSIRRTSYLQSKSIMNKEELYFLCLKKNIKKKKQQHFFKQSAYSFGLKLKI